MIRHLKVLMLVCFCFVVGATPALAAKGGGSESATIAFAPAAAGADALTAPSSGATVSFAVSADVKASQDYEVWVANVCSVDGATVSEAYQPVQNGVAGPFTLGAAGEQCSAYVWLFPDAWTPLSGGSMTYTVGD